MRKLLKNRFIDLLLFLSITFCVATYWVPNRLLLITTSSLLLASGTAFTFAYGRAAWRATRFPELIHLQYYIVGMLVFTSGMVLWRICSLVWLASPAKLWLINNDFIAFLQFTMSLGIIAALYSPGAISPKHDLPSTKWIIIGVIIGFAAVLSILSLMFDPDLNELLNEIEPYVPR
jgi:hypothetical protein